MKSRMKSMMLACVALTGAFYASCTDDALLEVSENYVDRPFELTVSQSVPASRLELGQDGLTTQWEPGDKLVLVDSTRNLAPIFLSCKLNEKASKAKFAAESGVPAGTYYVIYNYNEHLAYRNLPFQNVDNINEHDDLVLWNKLKIEEGTDSASVSLNHLYAKIKVVLTNVPTDFSGGQIGMYSPKQGFPMHKQFTNKGLVDAEYGIDPYSMNYSSTSVYFPSNRKYHNIRLGNYSPESTYDEQTGNTTYSYSKTAELSALVFPVDLRNEDVFFYILSGGKCYEIKKSKELQINLQAGTSYTVTLDMSQANVSTLEGRYDNMGTVYQINNASEWRHAAYRNGTSYDYTSFSEACYEITQNIDFTNEYFFPIAAQRIIGNEKKLSNITLDWSNEDNVGLTRYEWECYSDPSIDLRFLPYNVELIGKSTKISDLTLENVVFKGNNQVGAFGGWNIEATNCKVIGNSIIQGQGNDVGGIVGLNTIERWGSNSNNTVKCVDVSVGKLCQVSGKNYVGGIVGRYISDEYYFAYFDESPSLLLMESCKSEATVTASQDYVGGIFGKIGGTFSGSSASSSIQFAMEDNTFSLIKCVNEGDVTGRHYVGGIGGDFAIYFSDGSSTTLDRVVLSQSCSSGDVSGDTHVGGILGTSQVSVNTCYSVGEIISTTAHAGGIVGSMPHAYQSRIANCYSLATIAPGTEGKAGGIVGSTGHSTIINCYYAADPEEYSFGGIVGHSNGSVNISNCLTTLNSLGTNLGEHEDYGPKRDWMDQDNDGVADYDYNMDGVTDLRDLYEWYYNDVDTITDSYWATHATKPVTSILANRDVINGDNAYSTNYWPLEQYPWYCVKFASFSADTDAPEFDEDGF